MQDNDIIEIWNLNKSKIISFIGKRVSNKSDLNDLVQEIFIKLWTNKQDIRDNIKILNWLYSVCRYTIADYYKKKQNPIFSAISLNNMDFQNSDTTNYCDESTKLLPLIYSLPIKYRTVILLSEIHGLPHKVIAQQFDLTVSCVKTRVVRARKLLSKLMHDCCYFSYDNYGNILNCTDKDKYKKIIHDLKNKSENLSLFEHFSDNMV